MNASNPDYNALVDALTACVHRCADDPAFVSQFNRLTGSRFPQGGEEELGRFVGFVCDYVLVPLIPALGVQTPETTKASLK